jgi:hypothetical protein
MKGWMQFPKNEKARLDFNEIASSLSFHFFEFVPSTIFSLNRFSRASKQI